MMAITTDRIRRSVKLSDAEHEALVKWVEAQMTKFDAALLLGITRPTLDRILNSKSGSHESVVKIRGVVITAPR